MNGITVNEILIAIALLSTAFSVFLFFRKPQEALDKEQALTNKEVDTKATLLAQKEAEGKAAVLAAQFQYEREATSQRFKDVQDAVKDATLLAANHIHTIDTLSLIHI